MSAHDPRLPRRSRRRYLASLAAAVGACSLAGCSERTDDPATGTATGSETGAASSGAPPGTAGTTTPTATPFHAGYETTAVTVRAPDGGVRGVVTAAVADTPELRYTGLSDTESLPEDGGMLFVYDDVGDRTFVMRDMGFGLDIVYADDDGTITRIHHAPAPAPTEDGEDQRYPGRGQYVLEVNRGWTTEQGVEVGDRLDFER